MKTAAALRSIRRWKLLVGGLFLVSIGLLGSASQAQAGVNFTANNSPYSASPFSVAIGDLNGDSKPDLATANGNLGVSVLLGTGTGTFGTATNFTAGTNPQSLAIGDLNGDGKPDLAVANQGSGNVSVLLGTGTGTFGTAANFPVGTVGTAPNSVAIGDLNGDSKPDLAVANNYSDNVSVLLGTGTGTFGTATNFTAGSNTLSVAIGDLNGDSKPDLAVANGGSNNVSVLLGTGTGTFGTATNFTAGSNPYSVAIGDLNRDGKSDLAVANAGSNNVSVLLGTGSGSFGAATNFAVGSFPSSVAIGDLNRDSKPDLAVANGDSNNVSVLLGTGSGSFGAATNFAVGSFPSSVAIGDLDGDTRPDLAVVNALSSNVSVLLNATVTFTVTPTSLAFGSRPTGTVGPAQTVSVSAFGGTGTVNRVWVTGTDSEDFPVKDDCTDEIISAPGSCVITVRFAPSSAGEKTANLLVRTTETEPGFIEPLTVALTGRSVPTNILNVSRTGDGSGSVTSTPAGINCGPTCNASFQDEPVVTLTAAPSSGSFFAGWSGACSGTGPCQVTMSEARSVVAEFSPRFTLSAIRTGDGSGTITSSPAGINCGSACSALMDEDTTVTVTAAPGQNSNFTGWSGACSGTAACQVTMNEAKAVSAAFTLKPAPDPARFTKVALTPKTKKLKSGKSLKMSVSVTNSGGSDGTATVMLTSSNKKKLKAPSSVQVQVAAGETVKKTFTVRATKGKTGKVKETAKLAGLTTSSTITLTR